MPYFLVGIRGDRARAAGLLAVAGIQNVVHHSSPEDATDDGPALGARLSAKDPESAVKRVRSALEGEPFAIEDEAREEPGEA
ncbi:MAG: hypothetical protein AABM66_02830 [Actinomycetota bacterium]